MKQFAILGIVVLAFALTACDVERTGENSVEISTDTAATAAAADSAATAAEATETAARAAGECTRRAFQDVRDESPESAGRDDR